MADLNEQLFATIRCSWLAEVLASIHAEQLHAGRSSELMQERAHDMAVCVSQNLHHQGTFLDGKGAGTSAY